MLLLTPIQRMELYNRAFPNWPPLHWDGKRFYGLWILGNNYKGSGYYGAFPPGLLKRILPMFPDRTRSLHLFSGSLAKSSGFVRVDRNETLAPDVVASAEALPFKPGAFDLGIPDPPYGDDHAKRYGFPMISRRKVLAELARVFLPGDSVVWLDTQLPMYRKREWLPYGLVPILRSTNHVMRLLSFFQRVG